MLKRSLQALVLIVLMTVLVGCTLEGKWSLASVDPTAARRDFDFQSLTLQEDGTFYAEKQTQYGTETMSGTYTFENNVLSLDPHEGERLTYDARLTGGGQEMQLQKFWEGERLNATLTRRAS